jgi:hypothetical protein
MRRENIPLSVGNLCRRIERGKINLRPEYQRGRVWSLGQKQLLIDSLLSDLDIPKIYLNYLEANNENTFESEVVDGQQRLSAMSEFLRNEFTLGNTRETINGKQVKGKTFDELDEDIKDNISDYMLNVIFLRDADEKERREMFHRLQAGKPLNAAEKRNAILSNMTSFVRGISHHGFFNKCRFDNKRMEYDNVAAQMIQIVLTGNHAANISARALKKMYLENKRFDTQGKEAKKAQSTLDFLDSVFIDKSPELTKTMALTFFSVIAHLKEHFVIKDMEKRIYEVFIEFHRKLLEEKVKPQNEQSDYLKGYQGAIEKATTSAESLSIRYLAVLEFFLDNLPDLKRLDKYRNFSESQRRAIWRKDNGQCQLKIKCSGKKCSGDNWHADHITPWSKGGTTTVENGQVACPECNLAKGSGLSLREVQ